MTKKFFLLDANVIVDYYLGRHEVQRVFNDLLRRRQEGRCLIFIPDFCISEIFSTFAKKCYYEKDARDRISEQQFRKAKWDFIDDTSRDLEYKRAQPYTHVELSQNHLINAHLVYQPAWDFVKKEHVRKKLVRKDGTYKFPSTFDLLVIAQGVEMAKLYSDEDFVILTSDEVMLEICRHLRNLRHADKVSYIKRNESRLEAYHNLPSFKYPRAINARNYGEIKAFLR
ncbi:hypothetical protein COY52_07165 [Candidatus Desantisbacteria bacterium CG_4_10_14_0_8_um_filter_48_22]|uniref:PIN domain-containing protein n=1 Tax=Candidatus Desantisbacteria bacterium CG_4_10_14_0_8_um_filter_48_22 TaxID=1974543 RepID=A0A2M7SA69_9BACT|nr:MAG: hypothetical protein AUJ67_04835 [Candidatus Desantisbacteria bacterium CG1_02_49_89]PIV55665.1 MAG: hypothetical protein COS16_06420 [Candidatus Desantisbacteria bacterium CG02_land_8_20_14_3_00_49_13]PIZ16381.1 MAG: hypothetical protein COY52_07165 [Candidatus Desantisbacteria bacterium CG_4_10_14_0_8_um_filter_48_22]PJB27836.1 MAG: hypothetical protein CO111_03165 [Candidatus Desantisbacteria bacterium CG_4_9_14_3_um_filter_50_7]